MNTKLNFPLFTICINWYACVYMHAYTCTCVNIML